jgi:phage tail-like protein
VSLEPPDSAIRSMGFCEVILPELPVRPPAKTAAAGSETVAPRLVLRRGFDGATDLRDWWKDTRRRKTPRPWTVAVQLLAEDCATVVATWIFTGARPVSLGYSPLHASEPAVLIETVTLEFADVELR